MNDISHVLKKIREMDRSDLPSGIVGINWGPKIKDGNETGEYGIIFTVLEKKSVDELPPNEVIPSIMEIEGIECITDVVTPYIYQRLVPDCHLRDANVEPVKSNRIKRRPLMGGASSINIGSSDATLGLMVRDKTDGQIVALSNSHVYAASQLVANFQTQNDLNTNNTVTLSARQPGTNTFNPYGDTDPNKDFIGTCKRPVLIGNIDPSTFNYQFFYTVINDTSCDAAILKLSGYSLIDTVSSPNVIGFSGRAPFQFATDEEIDSLLNPASLNYQAPIFRSGRTLGPIGFPGNTSSCRLSVFELGLAFVGSYSGYLSLFSNSFYVRGPVTAGAGGDSGSAYFALLSSTVPSASAWKVIGLLFAGPQDESESIGCRITSVARDLNIVPWDTTMPIVSADTTFATISAPGSNPVFSPTIVLSGRTYYQLGMP